MRKDSPMGSSNLEKRSHSFPYNKLSYTFTEVRKFTRVGCYLLQFLTDGFPIEALLKLFYCGKELKYVRFVGGYYLLIHFWIQRFTRIVLCSSRPQ